MKVRLTTTAFTSKQRKVHSLEMFQNLLALAEGLSEAQDQTPISGEPVPSDWAQQVVDALLSRIMRRKKAGPK